MAFSGPRNYTTREKANLHLSFFFVVELHFFSIFKFYFASFLPTMTIIPIFYEK